VDPGPVPDPIDPPPEDLEEQEAPPDALQPEAYSRVAVGDDETSVRTKLGTPELRQPSAGAPFVMRWPVADGDGKLRTLEIAFGADGRVLEGGKILWGRSRR